MTSKMVMLSIKLPVGLMSPCAIEYGDVFKDKRIKERQLFISLSCLDLRPLEASLFRYVLLVTNELVYYLLV